MHIKCRITLLNETDVTALDLPQGAVHHTNSSGSHRETFDLIVGADGARSRVRAAMQAHDPSMTVDIVSGTRLYKAFSGLPPTGTHTF